MFKQGIVALTLVSTSWAYADDLAQVSPDPFDTMPVYSIAGGVSACSETTGLPAGIFGVDKTEKTKLTRRVRNGGRVIDVHALRENGDVYISTFFLDRKECLQESAHGRIAVYFPSPKSSNWWYQFDGEVECKPISYNSSAVREPEDFAVMAKERGYKYDVIKFYDSYILEDTSRKSVIWFRKGQENCESVARDLLKQNASLNPG